MSGLELWSNSSVEDVQSVIKAVYKQVLGNPHMMESERLTSAESQLCDGSISVREFVRRVAKSTMYRDRYFHSSAPYRFVELNFMHLLGRAPESQAEVSTHIQAAVTAGYDAEIDSYIDSDEYSAAFGENMVPYNRANKSIGGLKQVVYNRLSAVDRGPSQVSSAVKASQLVSAVATNSTTKISRASSKPGAYAASAKTFKIVVSGSKFDGPRRLSTTTYLVAGDNMTPQIQRINRTGARIVSITEV